MRCLPLALAATSTLTAGACTRIGAVPTSTGVSPIAHGKPGFDVQTGGLPGFYASQSTNPTDSGDVFGELGGTIEPDRLAGLKGLIFGGAMVDGDGSAVFQPYAGWRGYLDSDHTAALAAVAFGSSGYDSEEDGPASVTIKRVGAEVTGDLDLTRSSRTIGVHLLAGASVQRLDARGDYCVGTDGDGIDCNDSGTLIRNASADVVIGAGRGGLAVDFARARDSWFHGGRVEFVWSMGAMPRVINGREEGRQLYKSAGLTLTLGFGDEK